MEANYSNIRAQFLRDRPEFYLDFAKNFILILRMILAADTA